MRVCITGAAGFIGSWTARALLARGDEVIGIDNFDPYYDRAHKERNFRPSSPLQLARKYTVASGSPSSRARRSA